MRSLPTLALLVLFTLSGCTGNDPSAGTQSGTDTVRLGDEPDPQVEPEEIPASGSDPHGEPAITQSPTDAEMMSDGTWRAFYTVDITNGVGDLRYTQTQYGASAGHVSIVGEGRGGYAVLVAVEARGATEDQARQTVESAVVTHTDEAREETLVLSTEVEIPDAIPVLPGLPDISIGGPTVTYSFDVLLPDHMAHAIRASASSGPVLVANLHGSSVEAGASSGSVTISGVQATDISGSASSGSVEIADCLADSLGASASSGSISVTDCSSDSLTVGASSGQIAVLDVVAASAQLSASSGQIKIEGAFGDLSASTSSGTVEADVTPAASGTFDFGASSGSLRLALGDGAYDVEAQTSSGSIAIEIPDAQEVGEQTRNHAHVRSVGFDDAAVQTVIDLGASSGSIRVEG